MPTSVSLSGNLSLPEGDSGVTDFAYTVTRSGDLSGESLVDWFVSTPTPPPNIVMVSAGINGYPYGEDWAGPLSGTLYFAPGQSSATIDVLIHGDKVPETDESFTVGLSNARGATIASGQAGGTVVNDDGTAMFGDNIGLVTTSVVANEGSGAFQFVFQRTGSTQQYASMDWRVEPSGANPAQASDFAGGVFPHGTVTFAPGETSETITIPVIDDSVSEPDETFVVRTYAVTNANSTGQVTASGAIVNDDSGSPPPPPPPPTSPPPPPPPPPPSAGGQQITETDSNHTLIGGSGDDTLTAIHGGDTITGNAGADHIVFQQLPWNPSEITDFTHGVDKLDLTALFAQSGYTGSDPMRDGYVKLIDDGHGGSWLYYDTDGHGSADQWGTFIATLDGVSPGLSFDSDLVMPASGSPPPPPPPPPPGTGGQQITETDSNHMLVGGSGDDTLSAIHGGDTMTGNGGADHFVFQQLPWNPSEITDFASGVDKIDVSRLLAAVGYSGSDPIGDGYVKLLDDGHGDTWLYFDTDGHGTADPWGTFLGTLDHRAPASLSASDFIFR